MRMAGVGLAFLGAVAACAPVAPPVTQDPRIDYERPSPLPLRSELTFSDYRRGRYADAQLVVSFQDRSQTVRLPRDEIRLREMGSPTSRTFQTASDGEIVMRAHLEQDGRRLTYDIVVALPARPDWIWGFAFHTMNGNPVEGCFGCMGFRSTPILGDENGEQFHVTWGGNSISAPAVY